MEELKLILEFLEGTRTGVIWFGVFWLAKPLLLACILLGGLSILIPKIITTIGVWASENKADSFEAQLSTLIGKSRMYLMSSDRERVIILIKKGLEAEQNEAH